MVINPSFTQWRRSRSSECPATVTATRLDHRLSYEADQGEFAHTSAASAPTASRTAPALSVRRKSRSGESRRTSWACSVAGVRANGVS